MPMISCAVACSTCQRSGPELTKYELTHVIVHIDTEADVGDDKWVLKCYTRPISGISTKANTDLQVPELQTC